MSGNPVEVFRPELKKPSCGCVVISGPRLWAGLPSLHAKGLRDTKGPLGALKHSLGDLIPEGQTFLTVNIHDCFRCFVKRLIPRSGEPCRI